MMFLVVDVLLFWGNWMTALILALELVLKNSQLWINKKKCIIVLVKYGREDRTLSLYLCTFMLVLV